MTFYWKTKKKICENWQVCSKCWEFMSWENFQENIKTYSWYKLKCIECEQLEEIQLTDFEIIENKEMLNEIFINDELIKNNLKILWNDYVFSDEDKFIFFYNRWYNRKWLEIIFWKLYREKYSAIDDVSYLA